MLVSPKIFFHELAKGKKNTIPKAEFAFRFCELLDIFGML